MKRVLVLSVVAVVAVAAYYFNSANQARKKSDELLENFTSINKKLEKKATSTESAGKEDSLTELKSVIVFKLQFIKQQLEKEVKISVNTWKEVYPLLVEFNQKASPSEKEPILQLTPAQQPSFENWYYSYLENKPKEVLITYINFLLFKIGGN